MAKRLNLQRMLREIGRDAELKRDVSDRLTQREIRKIFASKNREKQST